METLSILVTALGLIALWLTPTILLAVLAVWIMDRSEPKDQWPWADEAIDVANGEDR